jgi:hypothetical protein
MTPSTPAPLAPSAGLAIDRLNSILIRCREGDRRSDWLPIIAQLAEEARAALSTPPVPADLEAVNLELRRRLVIVEKQLADALKTPPVPALDRNWMEDRERPPRGIDLDLWRSLHDLCRIVRSTTGETINSTVREYLAGCFDEFGAKLREKFTDIAPVPAPQAPNHGDATP